MVFGWKEILFFGIVAAGHSAVASQELPQGLTLDGKLYADTVANTPLLGTGTLKIQIVDSAQTCVLYEESQPYDTTATDGAFNITLGEATTPVTKRTADDSGHSLQDLFVNDGSLITGKLVSNGTACTGAASAGSLRYVRITVITSTDPAHPRVLSPNLPLNSIPSAMVAERAETLAGKTASQFVGINTASPASLSQSNLENIFSITNYPVLTSLLTNGANGYVQKTANGTVSLPSVAGVPSGAVAGQIWYDSGTIKYYDGSNPQVLGVSGAGITNLGVGTGLTPAGTISAGGSTISVDVGIGTGQIVQVQSGNKLPALDGSNLTNLKDTSISGNLSVTSVTTSGAATFGANVTVTGYVSSAETRTSSLKIYNGANSLEFQAPALAGSTSFTLPASRPGVSGYVLSSDTSGAMSWVAQTPAGLSAVSNTASLAQDKIWIGDSGGKAQEKSLSGDVSLVTSGAATVTALRGKTVSATAPTTAGQVLRYDGSGWAPNFISMFDLRSTITGSAAFGGVGCLSNQTLTWTSATDNLACSNISLPVAQITGVLPVANGGTGTNSLAGNFVINGGQNGAVSAGTNDANDLTLKTNGLARMTMTSSGNVGIGTTNPNMVGGGGLVEIAHETAGTNDATTALNLTRRTSGTAANNIGVRLEFNIEDAGGTVREGATINGILTDASAANVSSALTFNTRHNQSLFGERMRIDSSGNVGIGTTTPTQKLEVAGTVKAGNTTATNGALLLVDTYNNGNITTFGTEYSSGGPVIGYGVTPSTSSQGSFLSSTGLPLPRSALNLGTDIRFYTGASQTVGIGTAVITNEVMRITNTGNVGIGTSNPTATLDVNGTIKATGFSGPMTPTSSAVGAGTNGAPSMTFSGDTDTGFYDTSSNNTISVAVGGAKIFDFNSTGLVSGTAGGASVATGVGTTGAPTFSFAGDTDTGWWHPGNNTLAASTAGTERVRIDASGNVGIGMTNPDVPLVVARGSSDTIARFGSLTANSGAQIRLQGKDPTDTIFNYWDVRNNPDSSFTINGPSTTLSERFRIGPTGNVGIGTNAPSKRLHVKDDTNAPALFERNQSGTQSGLILYQPNTTDGNSFEIPFQTDTTGTGATTGVSLAALRGIFATHDHATRAAHLAFVTADSGSPTEKMRITSSGNVGIGTTAPTSKLHVRADLGTDVITSEVTTDDDVARRALLLLRSRSSATAPGAGFGPIMALQAEGFTNNSVADVGRISAIWENNQTNDTTDRDSSLVFYLMRDNTIPEVMRITSAGNVGIGSATPTANLDVNGTIRPGTSATTCTSALAGLIRKNGTDLEVCQSGVWLALSRRGTGDQTIYVRTDGSDTLCDGSANAAAASAPACAFATPNRAMDSISDVVTGTVTVSIGTGTYYVPASGGAADSPLILPVRQYSANGNIVVQPTSGAVILSGAKAAAATTPVATAVVLANGAQRITLKNLSLGYGLTYGIYAHDGALISTDTLAISNVPYGLYVYSSSRATITDTTMSGISNSGLYVYGTSALTATGTTSITTALHGLLSYASSTVSLQGTVAISGITGYGMYATGSVTFYDNATTTVSCATGGSSSLGLYIAYGSMYQHGTNSLTINCASGGWDYGVLASSNAIVNISIISGKTLTLSTGATAATQHALYASTGSSIIVTGAGTYSSSANFEDDAVSIGRSYINLSTTGTVPTQAGLTMNASSSSTILTGGSWTANATCDASSDCL